MIIEVRETHSPKAGGKVAHIVAADGTRFEIWPDKLETFKINQAYEVVTQDRQYNGKTIRKITKVTPVNGAAAAPVAPAPAAPASNSAPISTGEAEFVGRVIHALILKGEIMPKEVAAYTRRLREVWRESEPRAYSEAAE
jgi:biotin carboxyl carrier protein